MSMDALYHIFGAVGYKYLDIISKKDCSGIGFLIQRTKSPRCPACNSTNVILKGSRQRWLKAFPTGQFQGIFVIVRIRRFACRDCGSIRQEPIDICPSERVRYTIRMENLVSELLEFATVKDVANYSGMSWDTVKEIDKRRLSRKKPKWEYDELEYIAIDEIHLGRIGKFKTIVYDLVRGHIILALDGRGGEVIESFFMELKKKAVNLKAIAMDMSRNYWGKALACLPHVDVVFDRFHVTKLMNEKLDKLRKEYQADCEKAERKVIKGKRFLLLKNQENLDGDQRQKLNELLKLNAPLSKAYILKEELRRLWDEPDIERGRKFLESWCRKAEASGIRAMQQMAKSLRMHRWGILNYFNHWITTGPLEGLNNKIKTMLRKHYGLRDPQYLELKLLNIKSTKLQLTG